MKFYWNATIFNVIRAWIPFSEYRTTLYTKSPSHSFDMLHSVQLSQTEPCISKNDVPCIEQEKQREFSECFIIFPSKLNGSQSDTIPDLSGEDLSGNRLGPDQIPAAADSSLMKTYCFMPQGIPQIPAFFPELVYDLMSAGQFPSNLQRQAAFSCYNNNSFTFLSDEKNHSDLYVPLDKTPLNKFFCSLLGILVILCKTIIILMFHFITAEILEGTFNCWILARYCLKV